MFYQTLYADINQQCFQSKLSPGVLNLLCHPDLCDCTSIHIAICGINQELYSLKPNWQRKKNLGLNTDRFLTSVHTLAAETTGPKRQEERRVKHEGKTPFQKSAGMVFGQLWA